jgi:heat shock protein HslJ
MKKTTLLPLSTLLLVLMLIIAGCGGQSIEEATQEFCQSLVAYGESLATLESLSPTSTVEELKDAQKAEQRARQAVKDSAGDLREVKLDAIDQAWKDLDTTVDRIRNQDTLAQAVGEIKLGTADVRLAYEQLGLGNCPRLFPAAAAGISAPASEQVEAPAQPITSTQPITGTPPITGTQLITGTQPITATPAVTTTVASTTTAALPAGSAPVAAAPAATPGLTGVTWQLQSIELTNGSLLTPSDPALYTLTLQPDGVASVLADCFTGQGTYTVAGDKISFAIRYTGAMCPPPSIASQYANYLGYATQYALTGGTLVISYSNTGKITFSQASQ